MNKKMIYRILGALASALIIIAVFVPFITASGYSLSLWNTYKSNAVYLPIMIMIFGIIGAVFFSLNIKTEFAYMSTGAIIFFGVMNTIDAINNGKFGNFSVGYYFLVIGSILTGVMAFLLNMKSKDSSKKATIDNNEGQENILGRIDRLYQEPVPSEIVPIQPVLSNQIDVQKQSMDLVNEEVLPVQPIPSTISSVQPIMSSTIPVEPINNIPMKPIEEPSVIQASIPEQKNDNLVGETQSIINPVLQDFQVPESINSQVINNSPTPEVVKEKAENNPVIQEFTTPVVNNFQEQTAVKPLQNLSIQPNPGMESMPSMEGNPVVQEFANPVLDQQPLPFQPVINTAPAPQPNPTVQEFTSSNTMPIYNNVNTGETDIFGQPINR